MKISGNKDELKADSSTARTSANEGTAGRRYRPSGHLSVEDNSAFTNINLKGVTVKARRWFNLHNTITDGNGNFTMGGTYGKKATVLVKFKNGSATTRGINGLLKEWQYVFPVKRNIGLYNTTDMENINVGFAYNASANTNAAMQWVAATFMNNNWEMRANCQAANIPAPPLNLNVWLSSAITSEAAAPMLRRISNSSFFVIGVNKFLGNYSTIGAIYQIVHSILPDITLWYGRDQGAPLASFQLNNAFFHEQAHAVHYAQVGNNYWAQYIGYIVDLDGYGNKTTNGAGRIAISEAWGFFIGNTFNAAKYTPLNNTIAQSERDQLENQIPVDNISFQFSTASSSGWIVFGLFHDMTDNAENSGFTGVTDNVNAYNIQRIFGGLQTGVTTVQGFKNEVLNRNNNLQATQLNQLVTDYRY